MTLPFLRDSWARCIVVSMWRTLFFSWIVYSIKSRFMLSFMTNDAYKSSHYTIYLWSFTWHLYHITLMMLSLEHVVTYHIVPYQMFVKNLVTWYVHYLATPHLYQIALMTLPWNMLGHVVTCRGMSLNKSLITLSLIKSSTLAKFLQY